MYLCICVFMYLCILCICVFIFLKQNGWTAVLLAAASQQEEVFEHLVYHEVKQLPDLTMLESNNWEDISIRKCVIDYAKMYNKLWAKLEFNIKELYVKFLFFCLFFCLFV